MQWQMQVFTPKSNIRIWQQKHNTISQTPVNIWSHTQSVSPVHGTQRLANRGMLAINIYLKENGAIQGHGK